MEKASMTAGSVTKLGMPRLQMSVSSRPGCFPLSARKSPAAMWSGLKSQAVT
jgi:hypothetical protein